MEKSINESCKKNQPQHQFSFDLGISVSDSSGMVKLLRLKDEAAIQILQVEVRRRISALAILAYH